MKQLFERYPALEFCKQQIMIATEMWKDTYRSGGKILLCGNGGSCADCDHIVGELMKGFLLGRAPGEELRERLRPFFGEETERMAAHLQGALPAISLPAQTAVISAFANDVAAENVYAQLVYGYGKKEDLLVCLSTSGRSRNTVNAAKVARAMGMRVCSLTGQRESELQQWSDVTVRVPETETFKVQELHLPVYHAICMEVERAFFGEKKTSV